MNKDATRVMAVGRAAFDEIAALLKASGLELKASDALGAAGDSSTGSPVAIWEQTRKRMQAVRAIQHTLRFMETTFARDVFVAWRSVREYAARMDRLVWRHRAKADRRTQGEVLTSWARVVEEEGLEARETKAAKATRLMAIEMPVAAIDDLMAQAIREDELAQVEYDRRAAERAERARAEEAGRTAVDIESDAQWGAAQARLSGAKAPSAGAAEPAGGKAAESLAAIEARVRKGGDAQKSGGAVERWAEVMDDYNVGALRGWAAIAETQKLMSTGAAPVAPEIPPAKVYEVEDLDPGAIYRGILDGVAFQTRRPSFRTPPAGGVRTLAASPLFQQSPSDGGDYAGIVDADAAIFAPEAAMAATALRLYGGVFVPGPGLASTPEAAAKAVAARARHVDALTVAAGVMASGDPVAAAAMAKASEDSRFQEMLDDSLIESVAEAAARRARHNQSWRDKEAAGMGEELTAHESTMRDLETARVAATAANRDVPAATRMLELKVLTVKHLAGRIATDNQRLNIALSRADDDNATLRLGSRPATAHSRLGSAATSRRESFAGRPASAVPMGSVYRPGGVSPAASPGDGGSSSSPDRGAKRRPQSAVMRPEVDYYSGAMLGRSSWATGHLQETHLPGLAGRLRPRSAVGGRPAAALPAGALATIRSFGAGS